MTGSRDGQDAARTTASVHLAPSPVRVIGVGLLGGSIALGLRRNGVDVHLEDISPGTEALAADMGAGRVIPAGHGDPRLVIVAAPPDVAGGLAAQALTAYPYAVVTDVASVKERPLRIVLESGADASRYVGSHPMAGRETSGVASARSDLFVGRPWVVVPHADTAPEAVAAVRAVATDLGAVPLDETADRHDASVALVSHVPQMISSLLASRLADADADALDLAGQGLRDTTRIAASDPRLWVEILAANADAITPVLEQARDDLDAVTAAIASLRSDAEPVVGARAAIARLIATGRRGAERIPGKHGGRASDFTDLTVLVPDEPGQMARLLTEIGEAGINLEDFHLEHSLGQPVGLATVSVLPSAAAGLESELTRLGWKLASA